MDRQHFFGEIHIPRRAFIAEHVHLLDILRHGSRAEQLKEAASQSSELKKETGGSRNSGYIQRLIGKKEPFDISKMWYDYSLGHPSDWIKKHYGKMDSTMQHNGKKKTSFDGKTIGELRAEKRAAKTPEPPRLHGMDLFLNEDVYSPEVETAFRHYKYDPNLPRYKKKLAAAWKTFEEEADSYDVKKEAVKYIYDKNPGLLEAVAASTGKLPPFSSFAHRLKS